MDNKECQIDRAAQTEAAFGVLHEVTENKRKKYHRDWELRNMRTVSSRFDMAEYNKLQRICKAQGITMYALVRELIMLYMVASIRNGALRGGDAK